MMGMKELLKEYDNASPEDKKRMYNNLQNISKLILGMTGPSKVIQFILEEAKGDEGTLLGMTYTGWETMIQGSSNKTEIDFLLFMKTVVEEMIEKRRKKEIDKDDTKEI